MKTIPKHPRAGIRATAVALAGLLLGPGMASGAGPAADDPVLAWNAAFIEAVQAEATPPALAARNLAIFHLAVESALGDERHASREGAARLAAAAAAARVGTVLYPSRKGTFEALFERELDAGEEAVFGPVSVGNEAADRVLADRSDDGASLSVHYVPADAPGRWRRTTHNRPPEAPHWPNVRPFVLVSASQFRPAGPPALDSEAYAAALAEVRDLGGRTSSARTEEQTLIARFWADFSYTSTPPGHWNEIARDVAGRERLGWRRSARLFAVLNVALADAGIAAFECKYHYDFWRPVTAIRRADEDGNGRTAPDSGWEALLTTPSHPEYISGHSAFSGAAAEVLAAFFGRDAMRFAATSIDVPEVTREFESFRACAEEIAMSRLYGGIHYRFSNADGLELGREVGREISRAFDLGALQSGPARPAGP